jgi:hypothetical protein
MWMRPSCTASTSVGDLDELARREIRVSKEAISAATGLGGVALKQSDLSAMAVR